jgi:hypothetical protein
MLFQPVFFSREQVILWAGKCGLGWGLFTAKAHDASPREANRNSMAPSVTEPTLPVAGPTTAVDRHVCVTLAPLTVASWWHGAATDGVMVWSLAPSGAEPSKRINS